MSTSAVRHSATGASTQLVANLLYSTQLNHFIVKSLSCINYVAIKGGTSDLFHISQVLTVSSKCEFLRK